MHFKEQDMHELSIAMNIVEIVEENATAHKVNLVSDVEIDVGLMSGVVIDALRFALEEAVKSSVMESAKISINEIPAKSKCLACSHEFEPEDIIAVCPECGHLYADIISGKELKIRKIKYNKE